MKKNNKNQHSCNNTQ